MPCWPPLPNARVVGFRRHLLECMGPTKSVAEPSHLIAVVRSLAKAFGILDKLDNLVQDLRHLQCLDIVKHGLLKFAISVGPQTFGGCAKALEALEPLPMELPHSIRAMAEKLARSCLFGAAFAALFRAILSTTFQLADGSVGKTAQMMIWQRLLSFQTKKVLQLWAEVAAMSERVGVPLNLSSWFLDVLPRSTDFTKLAAEMGLKNTLPWIGLQPLVGHIFIPRRFESCTGNYNKPFQGSLDCLR